MRNMNPAQGASCGTGQKRTSKELLYSEYSDSTGSEALIEGLLKEKKRRPEIKFTPSSVLSKVKSFLPELEKAQKELETKSPEEYNLEVIDETKPVIEMNLELFENAAAYCSENESDNSSSEESDNSSSEEESDGGCSATSGDIILTDCAPCAKENSVPLIEEMKDNSKEDYNKEDILRH